MKMQLCRLRSHAVKVLNNAVKRLKKLADAEPVAVWRQKTFTAMVNKTAQLGRELKVVKHEMRLKEPCTTPYWYLDVIADVEAREGALHHTVLVSRCHSRCSTYEMRLKEP